MNSKEKPWERRYDILVITWIFGLCINFIFGFIPALITMFIYCCIIAPLIEGWFTWNRPDKNEVRVI